MTIAELDYLGREEKEQLLFDFNATDVAYDEDQTVISLFEKQVLETPDHIAVVYGDIELSYRELNERANQLGGYLRSAYRILPGDLVGIRLERSEWMIVAILAVFTEDDRKYFKIQKVSNKINLNAMRSFMRNLSIMEKNIAGKKIKINKTKFGQGRIYKNFNDEYTEI